MAESCGGTGEARGRASSRDVAEFNAIREELLLRLMDIVEKAGTGFAFPSQTLCVAREHPPRADGTEGSGGESDSRRSRG